MIKKMSVEDRYDFKEFVGKLILPEWEADIAFGMGNNEEGTIGCVKNEKVISMVEYRKTKYGIEISGMFTLPQYRNQGVGKSLINYLKSNFPDKILIANPYTDESETFFIKNGFIMTPDFNPDDSNTVVFRK